MRWITGGPDLPPELLQAQEDGQLVLFCGAGVSYPAGLPDFRGLVEAVYTHLNTTRDQLEQSEFEKCNFDRVLGLLETRMGAGLMRKAAIASLHIDPDRGLATHRALLTLATTRGGACRIVTTNFDRGFELSLPAGAAIDAAPRLSVPKAGVWNSVVHLHGLISDREPEGRSLVLTSADFGSAYLTERWASRFLSELFRRFAVLFVGYSVEDPVVRYMMDAFAADRAIGEGVGKAFVLAGCAEGNDENDARAWQAKGLIPVLYDSRNGHAALHDTLVRWAECHRLGLLGKESIIQEHAGKTPTRPFDQDAIVSQVCWALRDESGHVARVFAGLDPVPPIEWLPVFEEQGLLALPPPLNAAGCGQGWPVPLADSGGRTVAAPGLHPIGMALGEWLTPHLDKAETLDWAVRSGAVLHPAFRWIIRRRLTDNPDMPKALRELWLILASEVTLVQCSGHIQTFELQEQLSSGGWDLHLKHRVLDALSPALELRPSVHRIMFPDDDRDDEAISHFAEVEVVPRSGDSARLLIDAIHRSAAGQKILADLADDATGLLRAAMALFELTQGAGELWDRSYSDQPSISPHTNNSGLRDWTVFLDLCRDAWAALLEADPLRARVLVESWRSIPYPVFRRLCLFAMTESKLYSPQECLSYLLERDGWWLWSPSVCREKFRLIISIWPELEVEDAEDLVDHILSGPPRAMFRDELSEEDFEGLSNREKWLHLAKLQQTGRALPEAGATKLEALSARYPDWILDDDDRSEFTDWMESGFGEARVENIDEFLSMPDEAVLTRLRVDRPGGDDLARWRRLTDVDLSRASGLLTALSESSDWNSEIWRAAVEIIVGQKRATEQWPALAPMLAKAPETLLGEIVTPLARCLRDLAEAQATEDAVLFWEVWDLLQQQGFQGTDQDFNDPLTAALNTPAGHLTEALLSRSTSRRPQRASDLEPDVWGRFTLLAKGEGQAYKLSRVLLASRLSWLHSLHPTWVEEHLLPYFNWDGSAEAPAVWQGYMWQAVVPPELWPLLKVQFLAALTEKERLGRAYEQICQLFAAICLNRPDWLTPEEAQATLRSLDGKGRSIVARVVWKRLEGAGTQSEVLWNDQVGPWLAQVWPKDHAMRDPDSSLNLAMAATYAGNSFAGAVDGIAVLLVEAEHCFFLWERLIETGAAAREPASTLRLAGLLVDQKWQWPDPKLRELLNQIQAADAAIATQPHYRDLDEYLRRHSM